MDIKSRTIEVHELKKVQKDRMFELMNNYYTNTRLDDFEKDLSGKN